jgi:hypothetical protein
MTYYFALTAYDTTGLESDFTPELTYQVPLEAVSNAPPTLDAISDITLPEDSGPHIIALRGIRPGGSNEVQTLSISATSSNPDLIAHPIVNYSDPDLAGSLSFQPIANASGTAVITVSVDDGELENNRVSQSFTVTVQPVNDPPYFDAMPDIVIEEGVINHSVLLAGIHSGAANEADPLTVTATSSETNLIGISELIPSTPETSASLVLNPVPGASGTATITATVNDGQSESSTFSRSFQVTLVNTPPTISAISDQFVPRNHTSDPIPFTISDAGTAAADLQVTATSSNPSVVPPSGLILEGFDNKRVLMIDPANGRGGVSIIILTVSDRSASTSVSFQVTVDAQ